MKLAIIIISMSFIFKTGTAQTAQESARDTFPSLYLQNRAPLKSKPYLDLPFGSIQPRGWLKQTLINMKNGMAGHLDEWYPSVLGKRNGWLGGDGDVWERGPYWLDGLVPLAFILDDQQLKDKIRKWIEWSVDNQMPDGYFGPIPPAREPSPEPGLQRDRARDWWPKMVMLKVMQQYYIATKDKRVLELMIRYSRYQLKTLPQTPLGNYSWWGAQRGGDNLLIVYWLYNVTGEKFLLDLAELIHKQCFDWTNSFLYTNDVSITYTYHGVNLAQGIKEPVIYSQHNSDPKYVDAVKKAFTDLRTYQEQAQGMYGADELTRGNDPNLGSELCTAVEMMYSLENIMTITGDVGYMDHLEKIAYNALPTQISDDYETRQYYQQANQVMVTRHHRDFVTSYDGTDQCFGLLTGFPCCTTNMHQGWPKFVQNLWHASADNGIAALEYAPSEVKMKVAHGQDVVITEETGYPFEDKIVFRVQTGNPVLFPFYLRIPGWCGGAEIRVNGELFSSPSGNQVEKMIRTWKNGDRVELKLPMRVTVSRWKNHSAAVQRGPLVYALKIGEQWKNVKGTDKYGDYREVRPTTPWNYGLWEQAVKNPDSLFTFSKIGEVGLSPWNVENAPVKITTLGKVVPEWQLYNESAGPVPYSTIEYLKDRKEQQIVLLPYGCTTLRISQFPVVR